MPTAPDAIQPTGLPAAPAAPANTAGAGTVAAPAEPVLVAAGGFPAAPTAPAALVGAGTVAAPAAPGRINGANGEFVIGLRITGTFGKLIDGVSIPWVYPDLWLDDATVGGKSYFLHKSGAGMTLHYYLVYYDSTAGRWKMGEGGAFINGTEPSWWAAAGDEFYPDLADWSNSADPTRFSYGVPVFEVFQLTMTPPVAVRATGLPAAPAAPAKVQP